MIITPEIANLFGLKPGLEAYDNSTLATIDSCVRKAYWKLLFPLPGSGGTSGVADRVGIAAHFGSSIHSAMDKFHSPVLYHSATYDKRKLVAFKAFSQEYYNLIPDHDMVDEPYTHTTGLRMLADYFDHFQAEDGFFIPIETELCIIIYIPELNCYWISRTDGLIARPAMHDTLVREFKTTKSSLQNKIDELRISRQPQGYVWSARQPEFQGPNDKPITGFMADVLAVRVREKDPNKLFQRDIFHVNPVQEEQWYRETVIKITRWREIQRLANISAAEVSPLFQHHFFDRNTNECLRYRKCSFYELCINGPSNTDLQKFLPNDWNPLHAGTPAEIA